MDWASVAGIVLAVVGLIVGQALEGGRYASLMQPAAFFIVVCGTVGAVLLQSKLPVFLRGIRMVRIIFRTPPDTQRYLVRDALAWGVTARREGFLSLERHLSATKDPFIAKGLRMVIDGVEPQRLKDILDADITAYEMYERQAVRIWESAGGYAPTIGILGAVLGLIHVMENLTDPAKLGSGVAVAFVATIYGVALANLFFLPIANKLKEVVMSEVTKKEMLVEVFYSIAAGENARVIEELVSGINLGVVSAKKA